MLKLQNKKTRLKTYIFFKIINDVIYFKIKIRGIKGNEGDIEITQNHNGFCCNK